MRLVPTQVLHPSATEAARASRVTVRAGEERSGIDIHLQYVPLAVVSGIVAGAGAGPATITLARIDEVPGYDPVRTGRTDADGRFSLGAVPPGQYRMIARAQAPSAGAPAAQAVQYALVDVTVAGEDVTNVAVALQPGLTIAGQIVFDGEAPPASFPVSLRVPIPSAMNIANAGFTMPALQIEGTRFRIDGVIPGSYRLMGTTQGVRSPIGKWWLKSLVVDGRDVLDAPLDLRQSTDGAVATFTDRVASVNGLVTDRQGAAVEGIYVVVLPVDRRAWFYNSRRIAAVRTRDGRYTVQNLPPGDYRLVASADLELNEWFDPEVLERLVQTGTPVTIEGPVAKTLHLQLR